MESPWVLWLVSQIQKHIFRYWIFPGWRKMEVALTWHDNLYRQQAREHLGVTLQLPVTEAPIKPGLSDYLVLLLPLPYKFLWLCLDDRQPPCWRLLSRHFGSAQCHKDTVFLSRSLNQSKMKFRIQIKWVDVGSAAWSHRGNGQWGNGQCGQGVISPSMFGCIKSQGGGSNIVAEILMLPRGSWYFLTGEVGAVRKATQCLLKEFHNV